LAVVACCFELAVAQFAKRLTWLGERMGLAMHGVVVDNQCRALAPRTATWSFVHGSNVDHDFSAYAEGLQCWQRRVSELPNVLLFVNDSVFANRGARANVREISRYVDLMPESVSRLPARPIFA
jgi:hypothetical protein